jgi:hypothetical protein
VAPITNNVLEQRTLSPASSGEKNQRAKDVSFLNVFTMMMEEICSSEASVLTRATWHHIPLRWHSSQFSLLNYT